MKQRPLADTLKKRYKKIEVAFYKVVAHFREKDIHAFRLEVKKANSLLRVAGVIKGTQKLIKLHRFYKEVGIIRSLQLQIRRIDLLEESKYFSFSKTYGDFLKQSIKDTRILAINLTKHQKPFKNEKEKLLKRLPDKLRQKHIRAFFGKKLYSVSKMLNADSLSDESLHAIRKLLKDILYDSPGLTKTAFDPSILNFNRENINTISKILGEFQDKSVSLDLLQEHCKKQQINQRERRIWHELENKWWTEKETSRAEIQRLFKSIVS